MKALKRTKCTMDFTAATTKIYAAFIAVAEQHGIGVAYGALGNVKLEAEIIMRIASTKAKEGGK